MNRFAVLALYAPLLAAGTLAAGEVQGKAKAMAGGYTPVDLNQSQPLVEQAKAKVQRYFADLRAHLGDVQEAYTQVVAGTNVKLVCKVTADGEEASVWEFVIWHKLDDSWRLVSAVRISPLI